MESNKTPHFACSMKLHHHCSTTLERPRQKLLSSDDVISYYRQNVVFYLIPFTNPDGVYYGRSRTNYNGIDVESNWDKPEFETSIEVKILKQRMSQINNERVFSVFNNLHSQAASYCTFWIHTPGSTSPRFYRREYQFSNLNTSDNPYFVPDDYSESNLLAKFPEGWLWKFLSEAILNSNGSITIEMSNNTTGIVAADAFRIIYRGPVSSVEEEITPQDFTLYQ